MIMTDLDNSHIRMCHLSGNNSWNSLNDDHNEPYIVFKRFWRYMNTYSYSKEIYNSV